MRSTLTQHLHPQGGFPPPEHHLRGQHRMLSPCPLLVVYVLLLQHMVLSFYTGNLFGCGQLCHTQNRRALPVSDQLCLMADCFLALFGQFPDNSCCSVPQTASPVAFVVGHGPPQPLAIVLGGHTAQGCMLPMPSQVQALSEQLYCCLTRPVITLPNHSAMCLLFALQQI